MSTGSGKYRQGNNYTRNTLKCISYQTYIKCSLFCIHTTMKLSLTFPYSFQVHVYHNDAATNGSAPRRYSLCDVPCNVLAMHSCRAGVRSALSRSVLLVASCIRHGSHRGQLVCTDAEHTPSSVSRVPPWSKRVGQRFACLVKLSTVQDT